MWDQGNLEALRVVFGGNLTTVGGQSPLPKNMQFGCLPRAPG